MRALPPIDLEGGDFFPDDIAEVRNVAAAATLVKGSKDYQVLEAIAKKTMNMRPSDIFKLHAERLDKYGWPLIQKELGKMRSAIKRAIGNAAAGKGRTIRDCDFILN
jgi:hypothetical protein